MQGLFPQSLADPVCQGVRRGWTWRGIGILLRAALAPVIAILGVYALPLAAFLGGLASTFAALSCRDASGPYAVATMLLAGIALGALAGAATGALIYLADDDSCDLHSGLARFRFHLGQDWRCGTNHRYHSGGFAIAGVVQRTGVGARPQPVYLGIQVH